MSDGAGTVWTIGHSTHPMDEFVSILQTHGITRIADVRRFAGSRKYPHFAPDSMERVLGEVGIGYTSVPSLGGRRKPLPHSPHSVWRNEAFRGYADYMDTAEFKAGAADLMALAHVDRVAMMCAEGVWWRCHRSMISDYFKARGWTVLHILGFGEPKEHPYTPVARLVDGELTY